MFSFLQEITSPHFDPSFVLAAIDELPNGQRARYQLFFMRWDLDFLFLSCQARGWASLLAGGFFAICALVIVFAPFGVPLDGADNLLFFALDAGLAIGLYNLGLRLDIRLLSKRVGRRLCAWLETLPPAARQETEEMFEFLRRLDSRLDRCLSLAGKPSALWH